MSAGAIRGYWHEDLDAGRWSWTTPHQQTPEKIEQTANLDQLVAVTSAETITQHLFCVPPCVPRGLAQQWA